MQIGSNAETTGARDGVELADNTGAGGVRPVALGLGIGFAAAVLALVPWLATGAVLPLQNLWRTNTLPADMPVSLLPVNQYYATRIVVLLVVGGLLAGLVVRSIRLRSGAPSWSGSVGLALAHGIAIAQSFVVLAHGLGIDGPNPDLRAVLYFAGMLAGTVVAALLAQSVFWLASRRSVGPAALAVSISAVPVASWIVDAVAGLSSPGGSPMVFNTIGVWLPAIIAGVALGWCGIRPARRLWVWLVSLAALWVTPALFTAVTSALGMRVLYGDLSAMFEVATQIFPVALGFSAPPVFVAVLVGAGVAVVRWALRRGSTAP